MKVVRAKGEHTCPFCRSPIQVKGLCIRNSFKKEGRWYFSFLHDECYTQRYVRSFSEYVTRAVQTFMVKEKMKKEEVKPRGRPRKYTDPYEALKLKSRIKYYQKTGKEDKVLELEEELKLKEVTCG